MKRQVKFNSVTDEILKELGAIHDMMYEKAFKKMNSKIVEAKDWKTFMTELNKMQIVKTPWCEIPGCEDKVKEKSGIESKNLDEGDNLSGKAKTLCMPLEQEKLDENEKCFACGEKATKWVLWGRSY